MNDTCCGYEGWEGVGRLRRAKKRCTESLETNQFYCGAGGAQMTTLGSEAQMENCWS